MTRMVEKLYSSITLRAGEDEFRRKGSSRRDIFTEKPGTHAWSTGYRLLLSPRRILTPSRSQLTNSKHKAERSRHNRSIDFNIHLENYIYNTTNGSTVGVLRCRWIPGARGGAYLIHRALDFILFSVLLTITDLANIGVDLFSTPANLDNW
jgi:hypothetical protein